jgi:hypothetical protein
MNTEIVNPVLDNENTATGEPVTEQAPDLAPSTTPTPATLPDGFMEGGLLETLPSGQKYIKAAYVSKYAQDCAALLTSGNPALSSAAFHAAFLRETKKQLRRGTPYEAQASCAAAMVPQAIRLAVKHKAPPIIQDMITLCAGAVTDSDSFKALYKFIDSVYCYMLQLEDQQQKGVTNHGLVQEEM